VVGPLIDRHSKSPELNLFAQLCGVQSVQSDIHSIYSALRACISMGERGWLPAIALLNIVLGGSTPVPDAVSVIPPGYGKYLRRVALLNEAPYSSSSPTSRSPRGTTTSAMWRTRRGSQ
jgi:hypothetical protein